MKIKDLIKRLKDFNPESKVILEGLDGYRTDNFEVVFYAWDTIMILEKEKENETK